MLDRIRELIASNPDRESFFGLVGMRFPYGSDEYKLIASAYDTAKEAFRGHTREGNGDRYFEHLRAVALIIMVHLRVSDANVIAAALLHDLPEDIEGWTHERIALKFNTLVSQYVWWVTKQSVSNYGGDKEARNRAYHKNLWSAPRKALIIKLADRLHNMITLWEIPDIAKQRRKVRETQDFYLPLAEEAILLIHEIEDALKEVMGKWQSGSTAEA